ncbi:hypothetical protein VTN02DRAFT_346 [Thermoascus thermophilus]
MAWSACHPSNPCQADPRRCISESQGSSGDIPLGVVIRPSSTRQSLHSWHQGPLGTRPGTLQSASSGLRRFRSVIRRVVRASVSGR